MRAQFVEVQTLGREAERHCGTARPGDAVFIPDLEPKTEAARVDDKTVFVLAAVRRELVLSLRDAGGASLAGTRYTLSVEGTEHEGVVDSQGRIRHEIEVDVRKAKLLLSLDEDASLPIELAIGALEPVETDQGVRARLYNLGFAHSTTHEGPPSELSAAMAQFRECNGLPPLDDPLSPTARESLLFAHGS